MPPSFALPPRIQRMSSKDFSAFSVESALVAFESLMNSVDADAADLLHAMRKAGESCGGRHRIASAKRPAARATATAAAAFCALCAPRSEPMPRELATGAVPRLRHARRAIRHPRTTPLTLERLDRNAGDVHAVCSQALGDRAAHRVVDADHGAARLRYQPLLDRRIVLHRAVPVEVIGREVEQDADGRRERRREVDLERRALDHVDAIVGGRLERQDRVPILPPICTSRPASRRIWAISAVVVDLPLVPVMATKRRVRRDLGRARGRTARCRR